MLPSSSLFTLNSPFLSCSSPFHFLLVSSSLHPSFDLFFSLIFLYHPFCCLHLLCSLLILLLSPVPLLTFFCFPLHHSLAPVYFFSICLPLCCIFLLNPLSLSCSSSPPSPSFLFSSPFFHSSPMLFFLLFIFLLFCCIPLLWSLLNSPPLSSSSSSLLHFSHRRPSFALSLFSQPSYILSAIPFSASLL